MKTKRKPDLKAARQAAGKTVREVADHLGVSPAMVWRYESGHYNPDRIPARAVLRYRDFGVSIESWEQAFS